MGSTVLHNAALYARAGPRAAATNTPEKPAIAPCCATHLHLGVVQARCTTRAIHLRV